MIDKTEAIRRALEELGDAPAAQLAAFARSRYGVAVQVNIIPVIKATLRDRELLARARQSRAAATPPQAGGATAQPGEAA